MLIVFFFQIEIAEGVGPRHRFMSAYEQRVEPPDRRWQYLLFAAEPYETISFKVNTLHCILHIFIFIQLNKYAIKTQIPSREVDKSEGKFWTHWNKDARQFFLQFSFKLEGRKPQGMAAPPPPPGVPARPSESLPPPPGVMNMQNMAPPPPPRSMGFNFMG